MEIYSYLLGPPRLGHYLQTLLWRLKKIEYVKVKTFSNIHQPITVILAKDLFHKFFPEKNADLKLTDYVGDKNIPFEVIGSLKGSELEGELLRTAPTLRTT